MDSGLVDEQALAALRRMASDADLADMMAVGMRGYEDACAQMEQEGASADTLARQAHRIKGSAGTFGLPAVAAAAVRLEASALQGACAPELVAQLRAAVAATRAELQRRGLLPAG